MSKIERYVEKLVAKLEKELDRLAKQYPPKVPAPTPDQPDAPPVATPTKPATWTVKELKRWSKPWKVMATHGVPRGLVVSIYDRVSRKDSQIHELSGGKWQRVWNGDEETIGPPTSYKWVSYFAAERGKTFLEYNQASGNVTRGAAVPKGYKWNVFSCLWNGSVAVGADGPDVKASVFDGTTGKKLLQSPLDGLIAGMTVDNEGVLWLAVSDGQQGVCNSAGWSNRQIKPSSICYVPGFGVVVGSQVDGTIKRWSGAEWVKVADLDCSKINRMAYDASRGLLLASGAKPDTFATFDPKSLTLGRIARFEDEAKDKTGEQFDTDINAMPDGSLVLARANEGGCYVYTATVGVAAPEKPTTPEPSKPTAGEPIDWSAVKWMNGDFSKHAPVSKLNATLGGDGTIWFRLDKAIGGQHCSVGSIMERDGKLYGGIVDGIGNGDKLTYRKNMTNFGGKKNKKKGPLWAGDDPKLRAKFLPRQNERMWTFVISGTLPNRAKVDEIVWKE
jgi:hypothetical protein